MGRTEIVEYTTSFSRSDVESYLMDLLFSCILCGLLSRMHFLRWVGRQIYYLVYLVVLNKKEQNAKDRTETGFRTRSIVGFGGHFKGTLHGII